MTTTALILNIDGGENMKNEKEIYSKPFECAMAENESDRWIESYRLNEACCRDIGTAIYKSNYAEHRYDLESAAKSILAIYGSERVSWVLAAIVQAHEYDGRYSQSNKEWAGGYAIPNDRRYPSTDVHPILVDGFIGHVRKIIEKERSGCEDSVTA